MPIQPSAGKQSPPSEQITLQEQAYQYVKDKILHRGLAPGQQITDSQIAKELSISRTPVREALRRLEQEGFLLNQAGRGWKIYSLTLDDIHEIFDIREELESMVAGRAAQCRDPQLRDQLRATVEILERALDHQDQEAWSQANLDFHQILLNMCGNHRVHRIVSELNDQWFRVRRGLTALNGLMVDSKDQHLNVAREVLAGNSEGARQAMRAHLKSIRENLVTVLVNLVLPFAKDGI
jgi:DNA-binding GntR family transcriptional regulator